MKTPDHETVVFRGEIGEVVHAKQKDGRVFEKFRRPPGVRLVIISPEGKILLAEEIRQEVGGPDLRLPGGKVCDSLTEYDALRRGDVDILKAARDAAVKEALEETGLIIKDPELIVKANAGATVEWDLYYFLVKDFEQSADGQELEPGEDINAIWMMPDEIREAILQGKMHEWRSVGVMLSKVLV